MVYMNIFCRIYKKVQLTKKKETNGEILHMQKNSKFIVFSQSNSMLAAQATKQATIMQYLFKPNFHPPKSYCSSVRYLDQTQTK